MKKKLLLFVATALLLCFISLTGANAKSFTFSDECIYWPTWGNGSWTDNRDVLGSPEISTLTVDTGSDEILDTIKIKMASNPSYYLGSGLFIDVNGDSRWDFFADNYNVTEPSKQGLHKLTAGVSLLKVGVDASPYEMSSGSSFFRKQHPVGISSNLWGALYKLGYSYDGSDKVLTYTFPEVAGITLNDSGNWKIGYTVLCANDVFLTPPPPPPVHEPATMILLGSGLVGLAGLRRKFKK